MKASACVIAVLLYALTSGSSLQAQFGVGTWVQTAPMKGDDDGRGVLQRGVPADADRRTLTVENECIDTAAGRGTGKMTDTYARK